MVLVAVRIILTHSSIAGSETTATALACATYFLCQDSAIVLKLRKELDGVFSSCDQINGASTANLEYLTAVCREAMRMYPPLPFTLSRVVPKGGDIVDGQLLPEGVSYTHHGYNFAMTDHRAIYRPSFRAHLWHRALCPLTFTNPISSSLNAG